MIDCLNFISKIVGFYELPLWREKICWRGKEARGHGIIIKVVLFINSIGIRWVFISRTIGTLRLSFTKKLRSESSILQLFGVEVVNVVCDYRRFLFRWDLCQALMVWIESKTLKLHPFLISIIILNGFHGVSLPYRALILKKNLVKAATLNNQRSLVFILAPKAIFIHDQCHWVEATSIIRIDIGRRYTLILLLQRH